MNGKKVFFFIINKREKTARSIYLVKNREKKKQTAIVRAREMGMKKSCIRNTGSQGE